MSGERLFDTVQATWNLLERSCGSILQTASQTGMGVIVKEALANGRLTDRNDMPAFEAQAQLLQREANRLETSVDALALAAVLAQPWVDVVLSGAARSDHLRSNLQATRVKWDQHAAANLAALEEIPVQYWQIRSSLAWN
jgi:aryl-alcohol dehydrogenase-like predicted oxidoreductase